MKKGLFFPLFFLLFSLCSCSGLATGRIVFDLGGGEFLDQSFSTDHLEGESGSRVEVNIPDPYLPGYYFVSWCEDRNGEYYPINPLIDSDGNSYYSYPYGELVFHAYYESLVTINFDLNTESEAIIVPPLREVVSGDFTSNNTLRGYVTKSIPSTDFLPTVYCEDGIFDYWYTEYPLVREIGENGIAHYVLDTEAEKGIYRFDDAFSVYGMSFPEPSDNNTFTLYAHYQLYPEITLYFNNIGVEDYTYDITFNTDLMPTVIQSIYDAIGVNISLPGYKYYPLVTREYRFAGLYLDEQYSIILPINNDYSLNSNFDIYVKFDKKIDVNFDYQGGSITSDIPSTLTYYSSDVIGLNILSQYTPSLENNSFLYYTYNGEIFDFTSPLSEDLPSSITLVAQYEENPQLVISYSCPAGYIYQPRTYNLAPGQDFSTCITDSLSYVNEELGVLSLAYFEDESEKELNFFTMTDDTLYLIINLGYKERIDLYDVFSNGSNNYIVYSDTYYFGTEFSEHNLVPSIYTRDDLIDSENKEYLGEEYTLEGIYYDESCLIPFSENRARTSQEENIYNYYRHYII